jgi:hypothetical protein
MASRNFFAELKQRNVYKAAVAYVVVSWLIIQATSTLFPAFDAPAWVMKVLVLLLILGFPIALVLFWAFEITPEGIKPESEVAPNESITRQTDHRRPTRRGAPVWKAAYPAAAKRQSRGLQRLSARTILFPARQAPKSLPNRSENPVLLQVVDFNEAVAGRNTLPPKDRGVGPRKQGRDDRRFAIVCGSEAGGFNLR